MKEILENSRPIIFFTVLQKFKKVLDMQILKDYLYIIKKQPIVYLSLKEVKGKTYEEMLENMKLAILKCNKEHLYLFQDDKMSNFEKAIATGTIEVDKERQRGWDMFELYEIKDKHQTYRKMKGYSPWQVLNYYQ